MDELRGYDYFTKSLADISNHPSYSPHAMRVVAAVMDMTTTQLENLDVTGVMQ